MRPGGHLATAFALGAAGYAVTGSTELAAGCVAGAFLIDVDHYLDYLTVEGQWRRPGPAAFLRYYFTSRPRRFVLPLHSVELVALLTALLTVWPRPGLLGYVAGAVLHLLFDVLVNGEQILRQPLSFYSLAYRAWLGFAADRLTHALVVPADAGARPFREFFGWRARERRLEGPDAPSPARRPEVRGLNALTGPIASD